MKNLGKIKYVWIVGILLSLCVPAFAGGRGPANYFPSDDFEVAPIEHESWVKFIYTEDNEGILSDMRNTFSNWESQENYARRWNLRALEVTTKTKRKYLTKYFVKYIDRRISEEAKKSKAGSNIRKINTAKKSLNPKIAIGFSDKVRLRFKGRPLQGFGWMVLQNPLVDVKLQMEITGNTFFEANKDFYDIKLNSRVNYDVIEDKFLAEINKVIIPNMVANISYENELDQHGDKLQLQIKFSRPF